MATYALIRGNQIIATVETTTGVTLLPRLAGDDAMSLLNGGHVANLAAYLGGTVADALAALGLADLRASMLKSVFVASDAAVHDLKLSGIVAYRLMDIDATYSLWQCDGQIDDLLQLHAALWDKVPPETLGALAVVQAFGTAFYPAAVRTATGMTLPQALARRDRLADYLESLGYTDTAQLRAATNEHDQMVGIVVALGYTTAQLWAAMVG